MINFVAGPVAAEERREEEITDNDISRISRLSFLQFLFLEYRILYYATELEKYGVSVSDPYRIRIDTRLEKSKNVVNNRFQAVDDRFQAVDDISKEMDAEIHQYEQEEDDQKKARLKKIKDRGDKLIHEIDNLAGQVNFDLKDKLKHQVEKMYNVSQEFLDVMKSGNVENIKAKKHELMLTIGDLLIAVSEIRIFEKIKDYVEYRISIFAQDLLSYILLYPNVFSEFKIMYKQADWNRNGKSFEDYLSEELERVAGRSVETEIVHLFLSIIKEVGPSKTANEEFLKQELVNQEWKISKKTLDKLSEQSGLQQTLDELYSLAFDADLAFAKEQVGLEPGIDIGLLFNINALFDSLFDSRAAVPELIYFLGTYIPIIKQRFASSQPSPNQKDNFYDELKKVEEYVDSAISKETVAQLQALQQDPVTSKILAFFRSLRKRDTADTDTEEKESSMAPKEPRMKFLYIIWWALDKNNELSTLYKEVVKKEDYLDPGIKPSALFPGNLVDGSRSDGRYGVISLEQRFRYLQSTAKSYKEKLKRPGGLLATINKVRGYAI